MMGEVSLETWIFLLLYVHVKTMESQPMQHLAEMLTLSLISDLMRDPLFLSICRSYWITFSQIVEVFIWYFVGSLIRMIRVVVKLKKLNKILLILCSFKKKCWMNVLFPVGLKMPLCNFENFPTKKLVHSV